MAEVNILQGSVKGSIGTQTGVRAKGKNIMKAKIWSKSPPNETQTNCVRSFECLNRIASAIAKKFWYWLPYKQGNMNKHNVVASKFRVLIQNHRFNPVALKEIIPEGDKIKVDGSYILPEENRLMIFTENHLTEQASGKQNAVMLIFDSKGIVYYCDNIPVGTNTFSVKIPLRTNYPYYFIGFSSTKDAKGNKTLGNLNIKMQFPKDVFYTENHPKIKWWTENPYYLYGVGEGIYSEETTLVVDDTIG